MSFYLPFLNRRQARRRAALGLPEELEDMSIMTIEEAKAYKTKLTQQMQEKGLDEAKLYENAFDDVAEGYGVSGFIKTWTTVTMWLTVSSYVGILRLYMYYNLEGTH